MWACTLFTVTLSWVVFTSKPPTARYDRLLVPAPQQEHVSPPKVVTLSPHMGSPASMLGNSHCATTAQKVLGLGAVGGVSKMAAPTRHSLASLQSPPPALHEAVATPAPAPWSHEPHRDRPSTVQSVAPQKSLCTLAVSW